MILAYRHAAFGYRLIHLMCSCFFGLLLLAAPQASYAEGTVNPTYSTSAPPFIKYGGYAGNFDTPEAACQNWVAHQFDTISATDLVYDHVGPPPSTRYSPEYFVACYSRSPNGTIGWLAVMPIRRSCDGTYWVNYAITCTRNVCPANSTGVPEANPTSCTCDIGFAPDAAKTSCVPVSTCPIDGLTALTDPVAIDFENGNRWRPDGLTADYQTKLSCVQNGITARGGSSVGTSAYRPTQYQQHLFEILDRDRKLSRPGYMRAHPKCQALRDEITRAMGPPPGHGLRHRQHVATPGTSRHESGTAFDVTPSGLTDAQLTQVYTGCGVTHTAVPGEPWHVQ